ncbi:MAG: bifunctional 5,10-methylenetetrahydrofolate dehydrogenase/5,10-methenyltetrahydrofolate cyclohydrolase [Candidatus Lokiarchaeota archaeon]|nr:bifunctional 5,10-methylenetetrahydrofolate dehydrogenase/5,10-methenyltetrahydrofolate cyclohydrolase [Candidatus Lokiarchaeota archaeon]
MMGKVLDGKLLSQKLNLELKEKVLLISKKTGVKPKLAGILVGNNPASELYLNIKRRTCSEVGIDSLLVNLEKETSKETLLNEIKRFNEDNSVHGIILQLPLPKELKDSTNEFIEKISPQKDVDGLHPFNRGKLFDYKEDLVPCTPKGIISLLEHYNVEIKGKYAVIINRSNLVGKPLVFMLLKRNATVSICHTSTVNINEFIKKADLLIVAVGQPNFITKEKIKEGVVILDVGTNRVNGKTCGDVDYEGVFDKCSWITPNPGGVGPMTVSFLLQNTFYAYKNQMNL